MGDQHERENALLAEYRSVSAPSASTSDELLERVLTSVSAVPAVTSTVAVFTKLLIGLAALGGVGLGVVSLLETGSDPAPPIEVATANVTETPPPSIAPDVSGRPFQFPEPMGPEPGSEKRPGLESRSRPAPTSQPPVSVPELQRPTTAASIARETELIRRADDAIRDGHLELANAALAAYRGEFVSGVLKLEAQALERIHACMTEIPGASEAGSAFVQNHPTGGLAERVRGACEASP